MFRKIASQSARSAGALLCATGAATSICDPVNTDSWEEKWRSYTKEGVTPGFHESSTNTNLSRFTDNLIKDSSIAYRILVPLCGKSQDLLYLATFGDVVGIECVQGMYLHCNIFRYLNIPFSIQMQFLNLGKRINLFQTQIF